MVSVSLKQIEHDINVVCSQAHRRRLENESTNEREEYGPAKEIRSTVV